jgi:hypothetical protein
MKVYKVNVDVFVRAESEEDAVSSALDNMEYICDLENDLVRAFVAANAELTDEVAE